MTSDFFCSTQSIAHGESQFASAPRADVWVLLEHQGPWGAQAFAESRVPDAVKAHVDGWLRAIPRARLQLIRRLPRPPAGERQLFVALARETDPALYRVPFQDYGDLLALDLPALLAGAQSTPALEPARQLFLVCGNARRDKCCGKFGPPVYERFDQEAGSAVWQTTHLGGHRFAPTGAWLPYGLCFGRMAPDDVTGWLDACRAGRIDLAHARGRSCYTPAEQAAEYLLRTQTAETLLGAYRRLDTREVAPDEWEIAFAAADGTRHAVRVAHARTGVWGYESCRAEKQVEIKRWQIAD